MKAAFFHDSKFKRLHDGVVYTTGSLSSTLFARRYLRHFEHLVVVARVEDSDQADATRMTIASHVRVRFSGVPGLSLRSLLFGSARKTIKREVREADFLIVRLPSMVGLVAYFESRMWKKPIIVEVVGSAFDALWHYGSFRFKLAAIVFHFANRFAIRSAPDVVYVTQNYLQATYPTRGRSIGCSNVMLSGFDEGVVARRVARTSGASPNQRWILGTIAPVDVKYKGHEYVIRSMPGLIELGINVEYQLVGGGNSARLQQLAEDEGVLDRVKFLGRLQHDSVQRWLDEVDVYLQPSLTEGLPRALVEAMSRGCACIGTTVGGIPELLDSDDLVAPRRVTGIRERIAALLGDVEELARVGRRNFTKSREFDAEALEDRRSAFFQVAVAEQLEREVGIQ